MLVENYDPQTGQFTTENVESEFVVFGGFLQKFVESVGMVEVHMNRYGDRFFRDKLIGGNSNGGTGNYRSYGNNVFSEGNNNSQNNPPQENIQYGNQIDDFLE